nr:hypothetical protein [Porphyromonas gingivalis]
MIPVRENSDSTNEKNMAPEVFRFGARFFSFSRHNRKKVARVLPKNGTAIPAFSVRFL